MYEGKNFFNQNLLNTEQTIKKENNDKCKFEKNETFFSNYFTTYKKLKNSNSENLFYPISNSSIGHTDKKQFLKEKGKNFFGAFLNINIEDGNNIKCGIPNLLLKENNQQEENAFQQDMNKYLLNYNEEDPIITQNSRKDSTSDNSKEDNGKYLELWLNKSIVNSQQNLKTIPSKILEREYKRMCSVSSMLEETLLLNPFKIANYEISLQKNFSNLIYDISQPVDARDIYQMIIYLIQGIPSKLFSYNEKTLSFELTDINFRFLTTLHKISKNFLSFFLEFGTKMFLVQFIIENYLYNNDSTPFVIKNFYNLINQIIIKINESILSIKNDFYNKEINIIGLHYKVEKFNPIIGILFHIINLPEALEKYDATLIENRSYTSFLSIYQEHNLKSNKLINSLFNFFNSFHIKSKNYNLVKNLLISSLKSYLYFIIYLIFNNELIDLSNEYFIIKSHDNNFIVLDQNKVPFFLNEYKNIILNNTILLNFIKKYDENFFSVCNYKLSEFLDYMDVLNFTENFSSDQMSQFIEIKNKIFNKKLELMFTVNENMLNNFEMEKNEKNVKRLDELKNLRNVKFILVIY